MESFHNYPRVSRVLYVATFFAIAAVTLSVFGLALPQWYSVSTPYGRTSQGLYHVCNGTGGRLDAASSSQCVELSATSAWTTWVVAPLATTAADDSISANSTSDTYDYDSHNITDAAGAGTDTATHSSRSCSSDRSYRPYADYISAIDRVKQLMYAAVVLSAVVACTCVALVVVARVQSNTLRVAFAAGLCSIAAWGCFLAVITTYGNAVTWWHCGEDPCYGLRNCSYSYPTSWILVVTSLTCEAMVTVLLIVVIVKCIVGYVESTHDPRHRAAVRKMSITAATTKKKIVGVVDASEEVSSDAISDELRQSPEEDPSSRTAATNVHHEGNDGTMGSDEDAEAKLMERLGFGVVLGAPRNPSRPAPQTAVQAGATCEDVAAEDAEDAHREEPHRMPLQP